MASGEPIGLLLALTQASAGADFSPQKIENITVSESVTVRLLSFVNVNDSITVSESISILLIVVVAVSDTITVNESVSLLGIVNVNITEAITISESIQVSIVSAPSGTRQWLTLMGVG